MIHYIKGNILATNAEAIAHGANCEGIMNSGLAQKLKKLYPAMYQEYLSICKADLAQPGKIHFYHSGAGGPHILNLFTQKTIEEGAKLEYIEQCLEEILGSYTKWKTRKGQWQIKTIAMPRIGSGLGKLDWRDVRKLVENKFRESPLEIRVYSL